MLTRSFLRAFFTRTGTRRSEKRSTFVACPVCEEAAPWLDGLDFNKSCEEARGCSLPRTGSHIAYHLCPRCGFCFAPTFLQWTREDFRNRIYNEDYVRVDPDYVTTRPRTNADALQAMFGNQYTEITHLDFGGGSGLLSQILSSYHWQSHSYDPFVVEETPRELGTFDLLTAFEVFEHVPHVHSLMYDLSLLLEHPGLILFTTLLSDGNIERGQPLEWWYAAPRNGHVSLYSRQSLRLLGDRYGFDFGSFSNNLHAYWKEIPRWANHLFHCREA